MVDGLHIVRAGIDDLIPFVIFIAIVIGQILKARAKAKEGGDSPPTPQARPSSGSPEEELQEFLRSLTGEPAQPKAPPPAAPRPPPPVPPAPPVPARAPQQRPAVPPPRPTPTPVRRPVITTQRPTPARSTPPPTPPPIRRKPVPSSAITAPSAPMRRRRSAASKARMDFRAAIGADLIDKKSLRKAIVLREIFGPPAGTRNLGARF